METGIWHLCWTCLLDEHSRCVQSVDPAAACTASQSCMQSHSLCYGKQSQHMMIVQWTSTHQRAALLDFCRYSNVTTKSKVAMTTSHIHSTHAGVVDAADAGESLPVAGTGSWCHWRAGSGGDWTQIQPLSHTAFAQTHPSPPQSPTALELAEQAELRRPEPELGQLLPWLHCRSAMSPTGKVFSPTHIDMLYFRQP